MNNQKSLTLTLSYLLYGYFSKKSMFSTFSRRNLRNHYRYRSLEDVANKWINNKIVAGLGSVSALCIFAFSVVVELVAQAQTAHPLMDAVGLQLMID
jgi:hypothetical protein